MTKFRMVQTILRDVMPGDEYGVSEDEYKEIYAKIGDMTNRLFSSIEITEDEA